MPDMSYVDLELCRKAAKEAWLAWEWFMHGNGYTDEAATVAWENMSPKRRNAWFCTAATVIEMTKKAEVKTT